MKFKDIEKKILSSSKYIKEISIIEHRNKPFVFIYPDFKKLQEDKIINIEEELKWYAIELYNMEVDLPERIDNYKILTSPILKDSDGKFDEKFLKEIVDTDGTKTNKLKDEPDSEVYKKLKEYLCSVTSKKVYISSHIELDLGLDSLDYVELFLYIEKSFGVKIDEKIFADMMIVEDLCRYIENHKKKSQNHKVKIEDILYQPSDKKLVFSPLNMFLWKYILYPIFRLYFRLELKGEENIPNTPCIFAPTHQSMLDGFLVLTTLPYSVLKKTFFLSYKQVFGKGILRPIAIHGQNILIDANEELKETLIYTAQPLKEKNNLVIFPEGARSRDRKLLKFQKFFAILSKTFDVPVVPVVVDGGFEALRSGRYFPRPKKVKVTYLDAIYPDSLSVEEIVKKTKDSIDTQMKKDPIRL